MRVGDLMSRDVATIEERATCHDAIDRMCRRKVRHLPVLDSEGALVGLVTDRDIRHRLFAPDVYSRLGRVPVATLLRQAPIRDVMSAPVLSISPASDQADAAERMRAAKVGSLVVIEADRLAGILTEIDLLRHICGTDPSDPPGMDVIVSYP
jgi:acetoin utilization protein AcuB